MLTNIFRIIPVTTLLLITMISIGQEKAIPISSANFSNLWQLNDSIYRSDQPNEAGFRELKYRNVKSILNLRMDHTDLNSLKESNFNLYAVPMDWNNILDYQIVQALQIIRSAPKPLLIHCEAGAARTGVIIAMYRMLFGNYSQEQAVTEMTTGGFKFHSQFESIPEYIFSVDIKKLGKLVNAPYSISQLNLDARFDKAIECSGMAIKDGRLYIAEEKCKEIMHIKTANLRPNISGWDSIVFKQGTIIDHDPGIEGLSFYKDRLLMTDEAKPGIYHMGLTDKKPIDVKSAFDFSNDVGKQGIEGIAVNENGNNQAGICFVLKERNGEYRSEIRQFTIRQTTTELWMDYSKTISVQHPVFNQNPDENWRYTDICYDQQTGLLLCLKSFYFGRGSDRNKYIIDFLQTDKRTGLINDGVITADKMHYSVDISDFVNRFSNDYNTNLEGFAILGRDIYLVSDNKETSSEQCEEPGDRKTLFLLIKGMLTDMQ